LYNMDPRMELCMVLRNLQPGQPSISEIATMLGYSTSAIYGWRSENSKYWTTRGNAEEYLPLVKEFIRSQSLLKSRPRVQTDGQGMVTKVSVSNPVRDVLLETVKLKDEAEKFIEEFQTERRKKVTEIEELECRIRDLSVMVEAYETTIHTLREMLKPTE